MEKIIYTIGHSNVAFDQFLGLLQGNQIQLLVDVRSLPGSRYVPQFDKENFEKELPKSGIQYRHMKELGGRRRALPEKESENLGWRNKSFRGYADYMQTKEFKNAIEELIKIAEEKTLAIMCAEAVPWRCHRSLIADALLVRGVLVKDIFPNGPTRNHQLNSFAKVEGESITYPK